MGWVDNCQRCHSPVDWGSGGFVHNTWLFERPQKSVIDGPFRVLPKPAWFVTHGAAARVGRELAGLETDRSPLRLPSILWNALSG